MERFIFDLVNATAGWIKKHSDRNLKVYFIIVSHIT